MPRMDADTLADFLEEPHIGVLATLRQNGMPYSVPVWWLHIDGAFWITGTSERVWCKQLFSDPRASLCVEAMAPVAGFVAYDGTVELFTPPEADIWPTCRALVDKYIGRGDAANASAADAFFANMQTEPRLLFKLVPQVSRAIDMRVYEGKRSERAYQAAKGARQ